MQRAWRRRAMEGRADELRHGLPARPTHRDALHAARGNLRAHGPTEPATPAASAARPNTSTSRAPSPTPSPNTTSPTRAHARARASRATSAARAAEAAAEAWQEEAAAPRPVRPRATSPTTAAAGATSTARGAATTTGARAGPGTTAAGSGPASSRVRGSGGAAGALIPVPVHAVAAAEVGGDAEAARVLLRGVPVQLPDAGEGGHLQHRHRRQQAHHHLQRGEPQRLRHRLVRAVGGSARESGSLARRAGRPYVHNSVRPFALICLIGGGRIRFPFSKVLCSYRERKAGIVRWV